MWKKVLKRIVCMALCSVLLGSSFTVMAKETITPSEKNYGVDLQGAKNVYLCNKQAVDMKVGSKFFLTYTVTKMVSDLSTQCGVIITQDSSLDYPYSGGTMQYLNNSSLLNEGKTYFYRFEVTKEGLECTASWAEGEESDYIGFSLVAGAGVHTGCKYFGVWFGGTVETNMVGKLTRVRCYDENGKDLGIDIGGFGAAAMAYDPVDRATMVPNKKIKNKYSITLKDNYNVAISNKKFSNSDVLYMEYTVKSVTKDTLYQSGVNYSYLPNTDYPSGIWNNEEHDMENYKGCRLLKPGTTYYIRLTKTEEGCDVIVKYKENGEDVYYTYIRQWGEKHKGLGFLSLWLGEGPNSKVSAELVDIKFYDKAGNNLGVQINQPNVEVVHQGGLEDYSDCIAAYYNVENNCFIWLNEKNEASIITEDKVLTGTYVIQGNSLKIATGEETLEYQYLHKYIQDSEGNKYNRMQDSKVRFVSGLVSGTELKTVDVTAATGYKVENPGNPEMEGNTFVAWCTADGKEFDFDKIITDSITLYAKWQDGEGNTYLAVDAEEKGIEMKWLFIGSACLLLIGTTVVGSIVVVKRRKKQ